MDSTADNVIALAELVFHMLLVAARLFASVVRLLATFVVRIHLRHLGTVRGHFLLWLSGVCWVLIILLSVRALTARAPAVWLLSAGVLLCLYLVALVITDSTAHANPFGAAADDLYAPWKRRH